MKTTASEDERLHRAISQREFPTSRLSAELRAPATSYTRRRAMEGAPQRQIAEELGVSMVSVSRWVRSEETAALVPVRVVAEPVEKPHGFEVVTPRGLRIVALDMDALCTLLERHG
jgi:hypothetical protein